MDQAILREYLIALGFKVDQSGSKKVTNLLTGMDKKTLGLGKSLVGLATTVVATTTIWARQMEKMYYSSRYAETTVAKMQELEYGTRNIGLEAGKGAAALKNMTASIRSNPGLIGLLNSLGVEVKGRDKADVMIDLVAALRKMPFYIAERYANLFGIDKETLYNLTAGLDKMKEAQAQRKAMAEEMGYDADEAAENAKQYMTMWREVTERAGMFGSIVATAVLPYVKALVGETNQLMIKWAQIVKDIQEHGSGSFMQRLREGITGKAEGGGVKLSEESRRRLGLPEKDQGPVAAEGDLGFSKATRLYQKWQRERNPGAYGPRVATDVDAVEAAQDMSDFKSRSQAANDDDNSPGVDEPGFDPKDYLAGLEKKYQLPSGILDRVWSRESNRGDPNFMRSPKGAKGHFGFMDKTAKEYGLDDPDDFKQSADAAARKWSDLMKRYGGNARMAAAAYNWGDGNLARFGLGNAPKETRGYMDAVAGGPQQVSVQANPEIHIHGVSNPQLAADSVVRKQKDVNSDVIRNFSTKVR